MYTPCIQGKFIQETIKGRYPPKKNGKMWEFFPSRGPPHSTQFVIFFPDFTFYFWEVSHVKNSKKMEVGLG